MPDHRAMAFRIFPLLLAGALAGAASAADEPEAPPTGFELEFGADLIAAGFFNTSAYFGNDQAFLGDSIAQWQEFGAEPKVAFKLPFAGGTAFGALSAVGTYTLGDDASGLTIGIQEPAEVTLEQAHVGWRGDGFTVMAGNFDHRIGSGLLILDGAGDGGERGGWYLGMRKAFHSSLLVQYRTDDWLLEAFRLANYPRAGGTQGDLVGVNAERATDGLGRFGASFMSVDDNIPGPDGKLAVVSGRYDLAPEQGFGVSAEFVKEDSDFIEAMGWFAQLSYATSDMPWSPVFSARIADFSGDDPFTAGTDERFREIAYGYTDYGSWYQGEITGNYPLGNGNLRSTMLRMKAQPGEDLTLNVLYYRFTFNEPAALGLGSDDWGDEIDLAVDWAYNDKLYLIGVLAILSPGQGAVQMTGGDDDWVYAMLYASYAW